MRKPPKTRKNRLKKKADVLTEASPDPQPQAGEESRSFTEMQTSQSMGIKLSARDLLATLSHMRIPITEIEFAGDNSENGGTFADVAVARLTVRGRRRGKKKRRTVAVKKLRFILSGDMTEERFLRVFVNELRILGNLSHPNIVEIIGFVEDIENRIAWLVFPWEDNGNLREFLHSGQWELPERVSLIRDVALGLEYLHTRQPPICHGDLKSLNILVNSEHRALITDFGSARVTRETQELQADLASPRKASASHVPPENTERLQFNLTVSDTTLTLSGPECSFRWAPPDVLSGGPPDLASDVWAFGWIVWEAITDSYPFEELNLESAVIMKIMEGKLPVPSDHDQLSQIRPLCSVMLSCWKLEPKERPSVTECWRTLKWIPSAIPVSKSGKQPTFRSARLLLQLGEIHRLGHRHEEATKMYEQGLAVARSTRDQTTVARLSMQIAESHQKRSKYPEAKASYTEAMAIYRSIGDEPARAYALVGLGDVQRLCSNYTDAEASYTQAMIICGSIGANLTWARALIGLGDIQQFRANYVEAEAYSTQALAICESIGNDHGRAQALAAFGEVQQLRSNYVDAEWSLTQAIAVNESIGNGLAQAAALAVLGCIQGERSNYVDAESSVTQAIAIFANIGMDLSRAAALAMLGYTQQLRSNYVDAELSYAQAIDIYGSIGDNLSLEDDLKRANILVELGDIQQLRSNYVDAEASYTQAMAIYRNTGDDHGRAKSSLALSLIHLIQARYPEAKLLINEAARISERIDYDLGKRLSRELLEDVLEAERISTKPRSPPDALPDTIHAEDTAAVPLSSRTTDTNTSESADLS